MKYFDHRTIKTAVGAVAAIMIARYLGMKYDLTAGIVAIISLQATKVESVKVALERLAASVVGLFLSSVIFHFLGYNPWALGVFLLIFMPFCLKFNLMQGFLVTTVLATHILSEKIFEFKFLINESGLLIIGMLVAILLNFYMPNLNKEIKGSQEKIETLMKEILIGKAEELKYSSVPINEKNLFVQLKESLEKGKNIAITEYNNSFFSNSMMNISYVTMRRNQYKILKNMQIHFSRFYIAYNQGMIIADFIVKVSENIAKTSDCTELLKELSDLKNTFRLMELPKSREEFENRATLFQIIEDLREFLELKAEFVNKYNLQKNS